MSSTLIENLNNNEIIELIVLDEENLSEYILDLSLDQNIRLEALEKYFLKNEDNTIELVSRLSGMYQFSGAKVIRQYMYSICKNCKVSSFIKLEAAKSLIAYEEPTEGIDSEDDEDLAKIKKESDLQIIKRNQEREIEAYQALNIVCCNMINIATPCKIEAVCMLMKNPNYKDESYLYFKNIILDQSINCDYRYKTILSLENKNIPEVEFFLKNSCIDFLQYVENMTMYRILSAQYLLQKCTISESIREMIEKTLLSFGYDENLDYNLRADAADTLLSAASENVKKKAREIITLLGRIEGDVKTVFDNAQNVHTNAVEESVLETLEFFSTINLLEVEGVPIEFDYVSEKIEKILSDRECKKCKNKKDDVDYCSENCSNMFQKHKNIRDSLNRIYMDRTLYSKFNNTLKNILLKVWTYLSEHENKEEMKERLLEELNDMAGLCSTGFSSRLVNAISGFGQFNIRISWEDQIVANFTGRLNALAIKITNENSPYYKNKLEDVIELWINRNKEIKKQLEKKIKRKSDKLTDAIPIKVLLEKFLEKDSQNKISICVNDFAENVINEMTVPVSEFNNRQNFLLFFRTSMLAIREEMYEEFKGLISDCDFDLYIRKAIYIYEGC